MIARAALFAAVAAVVTAAAASEAATAPKGPTVPVVRCHTVFGVAGVIPRLPATLRLDTAAPAGNLAAYTNTAIFLIGPRGLHCSGIVAADGGQQVTAWATGAGPPSRHGRVAALTLTLDPACAGCRADDACPFFAAFARTLGFPCATGVPAGERVVRPSARVALFEDPPGVAGSGWPSGGPDPANGVVVIHLPVSSGAVYRATCTLPATAHAICTASLNDALSRYG